MNLSSLQTNTSHTNSTKWLETITQRIVKTFNPERIILFGSYAYGKPNADSDMDLLIVMESDERPAVRSAKVSKVVRPRLFPVDIMVRTPKEVKQRLEMGDYFFQEIFAKGKVLYERIPGRVD